MLNINTTANKAIVSRSIASKPVASKVALGWKETVEELPGAAKDKLVRTAHVVANPIDSTKKKWAEVKANPMKAIVPLTMMAGMTALSAFAPRFAKLLGLAFTSLLVIKPTVKFAKAKTEGELETAAKGAAKDVVDTAANQAMGYAAGKAVRYAINRRAAHVRSQEVAPVTESAPAQASVKANPTRKAAPASARGEVMDQAVPKAAPTPTATPVTPSLTDAKFKTLFETDPVAALKASPELYVKLNCTGNGGRYHSGLIKAHMESAGLTWNDLSKALASVNAKANLGPLPSMPQPTVAAGGADRFAFQKLWMQTRLKVAKNMGIDTPVMGRSLADPWTQVKLSGRPIVVQGFGLGQG